MPRKTEDREEHAEVRKKRNPSMKGPTSPHGGGLVPSHRLLTVFQVGRLSRETSKDVRKIAIVIFRPTFSGLTKSGASQLARQREHAGLRRQCLSRFGRPQACQP